MGGAIPAACGCRWREHEFRPAAVTVLHHSDGYKDQSGRADSCSPLCLHPKVKPQPNTSFWELTGEREESDVPHHSLTAIMDQTEAAVDEQEA